MGTPDVQIPRPTCSKSEFIRRMDAARPTSIQVCCQRCALCRSSRQLGLCASMARSSHRRHTSSNTLRSALRAYYGSRFFGSCLMFIWTPMTFNHIHRLVTVCRRRPQAKCARPSRASLRYIEALERTAGSAPIGTARCSTTCSSACRRLSLRLLRVAKPAWRCCLVSGLRMGKWGEWD
jgi:hypothetical protein